MTTTTLRVAAITGFSGSGKTTLIEALVRYYLAAGERVAAIKHTHHPLNERNEGDTARFVAAGADPVILAGDGEAVGFPSIRRIRFGPPDELLQLISGGIVFIEGFKRIEDWPRIEVVRGAWLSIEEAVARLDRIWRPS